MKEKNVNDLQCLLSQKSRYIQGVALPSFFFLFFFLLGFFCLLFLSDFFCTQPLCPAPFFRFTGFFWAFSVFSFFSTSSSFLFFSFLFFAFPCLSLSTLFHNLLSSQTTKERVFVFLGGRRAFGKMKELVFCFYILFLLSACLARLTQLS